MIEIQSLIRKLTFKVTGINSISAAINPIFYFEKLIFLLFILFNKRNILSGKFKSLKIYNNVRGSEFKPKYFGTYEDELDPFFLKFKGSTLIDIGCDDGYYSIGLLKFKFVTNVYAFEINRNSIKYLNYNIEQNLNTKDNFTFTEKMVISFESIGFCFSDNVNYLIKCDIEGGEYNLFTNEMLSSLKNFKCSYIIETHINKNLESDLIKKFIDHGYFVQIVEKKLNKFYFEKYSFLNRFISNLFRKYWLNEHRPPFNRWIIVTTK